MILKLFEIENKKFKNFIKKFNYYLADKKMITNTSDKVYGITMNIPNLSLIKPFFKHLKKV